MSHVSTGSSSVPGEVIVGAALDPKDSRAFVELNAGREVTTVTVANRGDRPVQVGSHFHFAETNSALDFDRQRAWGQRLDVPAGTSVRFEAGIERSVDLVPLVGRRVVPGLRGLSAGRLDRAEGSDSER